LPEEGRPTFDYGHQGLHALHAFSMFAGATSAFSAGLTPVFQLTNDMFRFCRLV
jgi:hypothetical protein